MREISKNFACGRETTFLFKTRESPAKCVRPDRLLHQVKNKFHSKFSECFGKLVVNFILDIAGLDKHSESPGVNLLYKFCKYTKIILFSSDILITFL